MFTTRRVGVELYGSLGATGRGHGSDIGALLGLMGESPETVDPNRIEVKIAEVKASGFLPLLDSYPVAFDARRDMRFLRRSLKEHANGIRFLRHRLGRFN